MELSKVHIGNQFYIDRIETLPKKDKRHINNALSLYCKKKGYTQAIIEHLYNAGLSGAVTLRIKVQEEVGIHIGVFKIDYYKSVEKEKDNFDKIKATGGTGSSLFMNIDSVEFSRIELKECGYKSVVEYTAADGLSESISDLKTIFYDYYKSRTGEDFARYFSKIIYNIFVSNFGLNGVLYSNQRYSNKYYDIHFDKKLQRPPREIFGAEWPPAVHLENATWINEKDLNDSANPLYFKQEIAENKKMINNLEKGIKYIFRVNFISYDISSLIKTGDRKFKMRFKFIIPGKYRIDTVMEFEEEKRNDFLDYLDTVNTIYIEGVYTKNSFDILKESINKISLDGNSDEIEFAKNIHYPNILSKVETFLDNPLLKVFMECLAYNDPNYNNLLISDDGSVKIIDYAMISQSGLFYDMSRFETIMKMEFIFDVIYPKYKDNPELFYKTLLAVEDWALSENEPVNVEELDKDVKFLYIFTMLVRYYMVELADMHYLHTFNEFKSGSFLREYMYSMMFFNVSFLKFKHDPPERKRLALLYGSYFMDKLEMSRFVSSSQLNEKIQRIKKTFTSLMSASSKPTTRQKAKEYSPTKFSIENLLSIINASEVEQVNFFDNMKRIKSANRLFDDFIENYFDDYRDRLSTLFINLSNQNNNTEMLLWVLGKLNTISQGEEGLKFEVLTNCANSQDPTVKEAVLFQLYNLSRYDLSRATEIVLSLSRGMDSRTLLLITFLLRCKNNEPELTMKIFSEILNEEIPLSIKHNVLDFVQKHYFINTTDAEKILKYLSKETNSTFKTQLNVFLETLST
jgi:predicted nucleic-acid-binding Zn-ribbon protein